MARDETQFEKWIKSLSILSNSGSCTTALNWYKWSEKLHNGIKTDIFNLFQARIAIHIETNHLICNGDQVTGFYMKYNTELNRI